MAEGDVLNRVGSGLPDADPAETILERQRRYAAAIVALGTLGTEVSRQRRVILDVDNYPHLFFGFASHRFVFPPQPVRPAESEAEPVVSEVGTVQDEQIVAAYDDSLVKASLVLEYDGTADLPDFRITEVTGQPETYFQLNPSVISSASFNNQGGE